MSDADKGIFNYEASLVMPTLTEHVVASYLASRADDFNDYMQRLDLNEHVQSAALSWALNRLVSTSQATKTLSVISKTNQDLSTDRLKELKVTIGERSREEQLRLWKLLPKSSNGG